MEGEVIEFKKDQLICKQGDEDTDLYYIKKGKLLVFGNDGTKITPFAELEEGEYLGEFSFFDKMPRSAHVVAKEDSELIRITGESIDELIPPWVTTYANSLIQKVRHLNDLVSKKGIRKQNVKTIKPLSIEEQRHYYQLLN